ncbi:MAG: 3-phosphoshikimate 1-carboxyvinyltransferase, partial [Lachnospiraceae bacterium]|nr:3-phosphoshikimate 1-carboxyvinyltransferase [Lachnospiraceae bacterium]
YIQMTLSMMKQFGICFSEKKNDNGEKTYVIPGKQEFGVSGFLIEPDLSGAAYFYSLAPLFGIDVLVRNVHLNSLQGDIKYVELLSKLGCSLEDTEEGLWLKGSSITHFTGQTVDMKDFSDQSMTFAAVSVFADTVTEIVNIGHIRFQETDRMAAIINELSRMGIRCQEIPEKEGIRIYPGKPNPALIQTYEDHRMAMSFTLVGLKCNGIDIDNPGCCAKTFENYFDLIDSLY